MSDTTAEAIGKWIEAAVGIIDGVIRGPRRVQSEALISLASSAAKIGWDEVADVAFDMAALVEMPASSPVENARILVALRQRLLELKIENEERMS